MRISCTLAPFDKYDGIAIYEAANPSGRYIVDNKGVRAPSPAAPAAPPFDADAGAGALWRAMFGGNVGAGTDEDAIYRVLENLRTEVQVDALRFAYARLYPGRNLDLDLYAELSGDEYKRAQSLLVLDWNRYAAVTIHEAMYGWRFLNDVELMCRVLVDARTNPAQVEAKYAVEYRVYHADGTFTDANLRTDLGIKLSAARAAPVYALLDGNRALSDARNLFNFLHSVTFETRTAETLFAMLRNRSPGEIEQIRTAYATILDGHTLDDDVANFFNNHSNVINTAADNIAYANAILAGDRVEIAVRQLRSAMNRLGTDEDAVWNALTGLFADERAMVAQLYRAYYDIGLVQHITAEFSDGAFFGIGGLELEKTLEILKHGGLTVAQQVRFAVTGWGTDDPALQAALAEIRSMTPEQIAALRIQYVAQSGGETLDDAILSDLGGRDDFEAGLDLLG